MKSVLLRRRKLGNTSCRMLQAFSQQGMHVVRNDKPLPDNIDYLFRWGCTSPATARVTVNKADAISLAANKYRSRVVMENASISIPATWHDVPNPLPSNGVIIRPIYHHQGRRLYFAKNYNEVLNALERLGAREFYLSEFIPKKREFRVYVIQGRVAIVAEKTVRDRSQIGWNHYLGGHFSNVRWKDWPIPACLEAIKTTRALGLDFGGIDVIQEDEHLPYVLEANAAPSLTSEYRQKTFAQCFDYIIEHGSAEIPLVKPKKSTIYAHLIHPALAEEARV